jgi:hypothetical protein
MVNYLNLNDSLFFMHDNQQGVQKYRKILKLLTIVSLVIRKLANRVGTKPGAIQLTRVFGPISAARAYKSVNIKRSVIPKGNKLALPESVYVHFSVSLSLKIYTICTFYYLSSLCAPEDD